MTPPHDVTAAAALPTGEQPRVSVALSPQQSVFLLLREVATVGAVRNTLELPSARTSMALHAHLPVLHPFRHRGGGIVPDALVPLAPHADITVAEQIAAMHEFPEQEFVDDIGTLGPETAGWARPASEPRRWLRGYAAASRAGWRYLEPRWQSMRSVLDRETERVGVASVRGGLGAVLNTLSRRLRFRDGAFYLDGWRDVLPVDGRRVVLVPSLGSRDMLYIHTNDPDVLGIAYPIRDLGALGPQPESSEDRLSVVLGPARASVLRLLDAPHNVGTIAAHLHVTPASASRHCDLLVRAGLVVRRRRGQQVHVVRTDEGTALVDLMSAH